MEKRLFVPEVVKPEGTAGPGWWFIFESGRILVHPHPSKMEIPFLDDCRELGLTPLSRNYLGRLGGRPCYAVEVAAGTAPPAEMAFEGLRQVYGQVAEELFWLAARAIQIVDWDRTHRFCGRCGVATRPRLKERAMECPACGLLFFPRLAPAMIVLVTRGRELLLGRSRRFPTAIYSTLAGFVEPGENLEETVQREVKEETGITVKEIRYFGSQPWPFPHSLMVGFTAQYASGEIVIDDDEIMDARWFTADDLPLLPGKISIARKLIDSFLEKQGKPQSSD